MSKPKGRPARFFEIDVYARAHGLSFKAAYDHFAALGRIAHAPPKPPIPDGWTPPVYKLVWTGAALARADAEPEIYGGRAAAEEAIGRELEEIFLDVGRRKGGRVAADCFFFTTVPFGRDGYDSGFTLTPACAEEIKVDAAVFERRKVEGRTVLVPGG